MNIDRFQSQNDRFPLLGRIAQFDFKTQQSISLLVGEGNLWFFTVQGRVKVQHPCQSGFEGSFQAHIRVYLPPDDLTDEKMVEVHKTLYFILEIPEQASHQAKFFELGPKALVVQGCTVVAYTPGV